MNKIKLINNTTLSQGECKIGLKNKGNANDDVCMILATSKGSTPFINHYLLNIVGDCDENILEINLDLFTKENGDVFKFYHTSVCTINLELEREVQKLRKQHPFIFNGFYGTGDSYRREYFEII